MMKLYLKLRANRPLSGYLRLLVVLALLCAALPAGAVRVDGLYSAEVPLAANTQAGRKQAFAEALAAVLVKVTGREEAAALRPGLFPDPGAVLQSYRQAGSGRIRVSFAPDAVRRTLDEADQPVWSAERPAVIVWLAADQGTGQRSLLGANAAIPTADDQQAQLFDGWRDELLDEADRRGLALTLPLVDAEDLAKVSFADIWGGFNDVVVDASSRYAADVVLIGRLRAAGASGYKVRWSMITDQRTVDWQGGVAAGPAGAADKLGAALATFAASSGTISLTVGGLDSFDDYTAVLVYLRSLSLVERADVARINGNRVEFAITARADSKRLDSAIRRGGKLRPWSGAQSGQGGLADFRLGDGLMYTYGR